MIDYDVIYEDEALRQDAPETLVRSVLDRFAYEILGDGVFSLSFVCAQTMKENNLAYRGIDDATDILTFAIAQDSDDDFPELQEEEKEWGDILICTERMKENASRFACTANEELVRLIIHGLLHLSGLDHETNDFSCEPMLRRQEDLLKTFFN